MQMVNMHGAKLEAPEESLAVVERLLRETEGNKSMERLRLHLEMRREALLSKIEQMHMEAERSEQCTGLKNTGKSTA